MSLNGTLKRYIPLLLHPQSEELNVLTYISYLGIGLLATLFLYQSLAPRHEKGGIRKLGGLPLATAWAFFTKRYDFIWANFGSDPHFKFKVLQVGLFSYVQG